MAQQLKRRDFNVAGSETEPAFTCVCPRFSPANGDVFYIRFSAHSLEHEVSGVGHSTAPARFQRSTRSLSTPHAKMMSFRCTGFGPRSKHR